MPRIPCPACKTEVNYPRDAEPGTEVTCPACDEVFVPPELRANPKDPKQKAYDPEEDDAYEVRPAIADPDAEKKGQRLAAATYHAARRERTRQTSGRKRWHEGPEVWLLIAGVGTAAGLPFGFWLARNWEKMAAAKFFWLMVGLTVVALTALSLGMGSWAWLRKNR